MVEKWRQDAKNSSVETTLKLHWNYTNYTPNYTDNRWMASGRRLLSVVNYIETTLQTTLAKKNRAD